MKLYFVLSIGYVTSPKITPESQTHIDCCPSDWKRYLTRRSSGREGDLGDGAKDYLLPLNTTVMLLHLLVRAWLRCYLLVSELRTHEQF